MIAGSMVIHVVPVLHIAQSPPPEHCVHTMKSAWGLRLRCAQMSPAQVGFIPTTLPPVVVGQLDLTQSLSGPAEDQSANTRGLVTLSAGPPNFSNSTPVRSCKLPCMHACMLLEPESPCQMHQTLPAPVSLPDCKTLGPAAFAGSGEPDHVVDTTCRSRWPPCQWAAPHPRWPPEASVR